MLTRALEFFRELHRRNPMLSALGWANVGLLAIALAAAPFDSRTVTGLNPWIKPMKFAVSVAVFVWTMGWLLEHLKAYRRTVRALSWTLVAVFAVEQIAIFTQAARGTTSHFNVRQPLDAAIFSAMGLMIIVNTSAAVLTLLLFFRRTEPLAPAYLWGIRLGLLLFLAASLQGYTMISNMGHTVGAPDGGPGLPLTNWSTRAGDLRIAHSLGLHALQVLPLVGHALSRRPGQERRHQVAYLCAFAAVYAAAFALLFWQASLGRPLLALAD